MSVWEERGVVLAWAWMELPGQLDLLIDPAVTSLLPLVLDWFETIAPGPRVSCLVMEDDSHEGTALTGRGYTPQQDGPFFRRHTHDLTDLPTPAMPNGFSITHVTLRGCSVVALRRLGFAPSARHVVKPDRRPEI
ncbi:hypothetical protein [Nocardia sp. CA-120079]|uniref:hypothetical protein n=1 Tax=Nocardia sp. CA-120079 TaxID=3239974 RepID=UPI003D95E066